MRWISSGGMFVFWSILGDFAGETADLTRFLDQTVVQIARAVEIHHVKVLQYRPPQLGSPSHCGCWMERRCRSQRHVVGGPTFAAWPGISDSRAGHY